MRTLLFAAVAALAAPSAAQTNYCESYRNGGTWGLQLNWRNLSIADPGAFLSGGVQFVPYGGGIALLVACGFGEGSSNPFLPVRMIYNEYCPEWREMLLLGWWWSHPVSEINPGDYVTLAQLTNGAPVPVPRVDLASMPTGFVIYPVRMPVPMRIQDGTGYGVSIGNPGTQPYWPSPMVSAYLIAPASGSW